MLGPAGQPKHGCEATADSMCVLLIHTVLAACIYARACKTGQARSSMGVSLWWLCTRCAVGCRHHLGRLSPLLQASEVLQILKSLAELQVYASLCRLRQVSRVL